MVGVARDGFRSMRVARDVHRSMRVARDVHSSSGVAREVHRSSGGELMRKYIALFCVLRRGQSDSLTQHNNNINSCTAPAGGHSPCKVTHIGTWFQFSSTVLAVLHADQVQNISLIYIILSYMSILEITIGVPICWTEHTRLDH